MKEVRKREAAWFSRVFVNVHADDSVTTGTQIDTQILGWRESEKFIFLCPEQNASLAPLEEKRDIKFIFEQVAKADVDGHRQSCLGCKR